MYLFLQIERERKWKREGVSEGEYVCSHIPKMSEEKDKSSLDRQAALPQYLHQHHSNNHHHNRHLEVPFLERSMNHLTKTNYEQMKIAVRCRRIDRILYKYLFFLAINNNTNTNTITITITYYFFFCCCCCCWWWWWC